MIILISTITLASLETQWELIMYWRLNEIEYIEYDGSIWLPITENINVFILKKFEYITFEFDSNTTIEEFELFLKTEKLPYSEQFRKDLLKHLNENWDYYNTFGEEPEPYFESIDNELFYISFYSNNGEANLMIK